MYSRIRDSTSRFYSPNPNENVAASFAADLQPTVSEKYAEWFIEAFVVNEATGLTVQAINTTRYQPLQEVGSLMYTIQTPPKDMITSCHRVALEPFPGRFSSMDVSPKYGKLCWASSEPRGARIGLLGLPTSHDDDSPPIRYRWTLIDDTVWQIETAPIGGDFFAIASSRGLHTLQILPESLEAFQPTGASLSNDHGYHTVAFGAVDRLIFAGQRSGLVQMCDTRSRGAAARILNSDGATRIKTIDENRFVIRGLKQVRYLYFITTPLLIKSPRSHIGV